MPAPHRSLPWNGNLDQHPMPRVLLDLWRRGFTGLLSLSHGRVERKVMWHEGAPVSAESNRKADDLGQRLLEAGRIREGDLERVEEARERDGGSESAALLTLELIDPKELVQLLRDQLRHQLSDSFGWPQGSYSLDEGQAPKPELQAFRIDPLQVIQDGLAGHWRPDRILSDLDGQLARYATPNARFEGLSARLRTHPEAVATVEAVDPARPFGEAVCTSLDPMRLATAWVLAEAGGLDFEDSPPGSEPGPEPDAGPAFEFQIEVRDLARDTGGSGTEEREMLELETPEAEALRKEVLERHERLDELGHYEVLGIPVDAADSAVKKAYFALAKQFHPDAVGRLGLVAIHREANELFGRIAQAYQTLSNPNRRNAYDRRQDDSGPAVDANRVAQAETLFRKGDVLIKVGNFGGALDFLRPCVELWPDEPDYQGALGWALYKHKPSDPEGAREHLERALEMRDGDSVLTFRLGMVLRRLGETEKAQEFLDRAKQLEKGDKP